ncbi:myb domain-containing protein, partial [Chrysochromulina tobinii]
LHTFHKAKGPYLIVVPLSTVPHWQREVRDWTSLHAVLFHGPADAREILLDYEWASKPRALTKAKGFGATLARPNFDVCITTYETFTACAETFRKVERWAYLILDEAHRLKNKFGKALAALQSLGPIPTLALTGTPLQNNVGELWSILNLLDAEGFPSLDTFLEQYGDMTSAAQVDALTERLRPYLLRRTKADVDLGITPMEETLVTVEITNYQKQTYRALLEQNRSLLLRGASHVNGPSFNNLAIQLRHCCNHPFLIKGVMQAEGIDLAEDAEYLTRLVASSGKLVLLDKLLPKLQQQGHRVLLFSQFTMLLDLLEDYLKLSRYSYERLDGSITGEKRQAAIDRFSHPESKTFLFLLGTRAGGVGINLTAADTVIIYDPDWNPQNDVQAQARCHRIGQTKVVSVYRLITKGTYEQTMYERANIKLGLEQAIIGRGDYAAQTTAGAADDEGGGSTSGKAKGGKAKEAERAAELEGLLKHGAQELFTDEHDERIAAFSAEDIDSILGRCATKKTGTEEDEKAKAKGTFAQAAFRMAPSWSDEEDAKDPKESKRKREANEWTRTQLSALYSGLLSFGFGRAERLHASSAALSMRSIDEVERASQYTTALALRTACQPSADDKDATRRRKGTAGKDDKEEEGEEATVEAALAIAKHLEAADKARQEQQPPDPGASAAMKLARLWFFMRSGQALRAGEEPPEAPEEMVRVQPSMATWFDTRIISKAKQLTAHLIDMRRLHAAIEAAPPDGFMAPHVPIKFACPELAPSETSASHLAEWTKDHDAALLVGVHTHGYANWEAIFADASLGAFTDIAPCSSAVAGGIDPPVKLLASNHAASHAADGRTSGSLPADEVDARLWVGAFAAGWTIHRSGTAQVGYHYRYVSPSGEVYKSRSAVRGAPQQFTQTLSQQPPQGDEPPVPDASVPPNGWKWLHEGETIEVEVAASEDAPAVWVTAEVLTVRIDGSFQARIVLPDGSDQWDDWFSWQEEGSDWRRRAKRVLALPSARKYSVDPRALLRRLKHLLNHLPVSGVSGEASASSSGSAAETREGTSGDASMGVSGADAVSNAEEDAAMERVSFVVSLYPDGFDRMRLSEMSLEVNHAAGAPTIKKSEGGTGLWAGASSGPPSCEEERVAREEYRALILEAKACLGSNPERVAELHRLATEAKERARQAASGAKEREKLELQAAKEAARELERREKAEQLAAKKQAQRDERDRLVISKILEEIVMRAAKMRVHEIEREERAKLKAERRLSKHKELVHEEPADEVDAKLWVGAFAAGWKVRRSGVAEVGYHYRYVSPSGEVYKTRSAVPPPPKKLRTSFDPAQEAERSVKLLASLAEYLENCGGSTEMINGWYTKTEFRKEGATAGTYDSYFFNAQGKRFRSRAEIARHFNLEPAPVKRETQQPAQGDEPPVPGASVPPNGWKWLHEGETIEVEVAASEDAPA